MIKKIPWRKRKSAGEYISLEDTVEWLRFKDTSGRFQVFYKKAILINFEKLMRNSYAGVSFLIKFHV